ncbi:hypothetical protein [Arcobacter venerupis]|nr:hypothetical protein [Arcobacter venerupis]
MAGTKDIFIKELAELIKNIVEFRGELIFNIDKPDGSLENQLMYLIFII